MSKLREKAEALLSKFNSEGAKSEYLDKDVFELIHEIIVHQKELEIQNEELKLKQQELEDARNKYFELYDKAPAGYVTLNDKGIILEYNSTFTDIIEYAPIRKGYTSFFNFIDEDNRDKLAAIYRDYFKKPFVTRLELRLKSSKLKYISLYGKSTTLPDGSEGLWLTINDITNCYLTNLKLKTYYDIIENAQVAVIITDKDNNIEYVNSFFS
ncbi:PAS domain-containing protein [Deferribacterales bacterium Es71-Z0220]|uniref:PAS domain-containing protein n=1 Tax=Deferrivibrio essentukiensis TaxID=2880922 RepID=UPI001F600747|nr:PAS domain-containing protein [Deferrivibrio essentukiensis]MCB4203797.1 PAS domain-containing protein [Deferrivibrio essentukiensis]